MPVLDKPLSELKTYMGSSPCPEDIDAYWDKMIAKMKAIDPKTELVKADFQVPGMTCYHMYFTGINKARQHAKLVKPNRVDDKKYPAVLRFHGYYGESPIWSDMISYAALGFTVAALDVRGQGGFSEDSGGYKGTTIKGNIVRGLLDGEEKLMFAHIYLDTAQFAGIIMDMEDVDENRVGCTGNSQGGGLTIACAALEPRMKMAAPLHPFLIDYKRVWNMDLDVAAYEEIRYFFKKFDPEHKREDEIFYQLGYIDLQNIAKRIKAKTLVGIGLLDDICPPSTCFAAYNKMKCEKEIKVYPDFKHEFIGAFNDDTFLFLKEL
jgi:cephalosporin-C deacetylase